MRLLVIERCGVRGNGCLKRPILCGFQGEVLPIAKMKVLR